MKDKKYHKYDEIKKFAQKLVEIPTSELLFKSFLDDSLIPDDMEKRIKIAEMIANGEAEFEFEGNPLEEEKILVMAQLIFGVLKMEKMRKEIEKVSAKWMFMRDSGPVLIANEYEKIDRKHLSNIASHPRKTWKEEAIETIKLNWEKDNYITWEDMADRILEYYRPKGISLSTINKWISKLKLKPKVRGYSHPFELVFPSWRSAL